MIHEMDLSPTKEAALKAYDEFLVRYEAKYVCTSLEDLKDVNIRLDTTFLKN